MANIELARDVQNLRENISRLSNGEARIIDFNTEEPSIKVELYFKTGFYKGGTFVFHVKLSPNYPHGERDVIFLTKIFHPGVDEKKCSLSGLDISYGSLEEIVKDVYNQIRNPNFQAIQHPLFYDDLFIEDQSVLRAKFAEDVQMSLKVDEILAEMNALGKTVVGPK
ncbi:uncharacterized protein LOC114537902 [Dendronephthya gigantea]|uniref:uncharacterized protein LOC114537902 n=1 Tax=Dendronephthya gigantea TaxID=151771 RepID=UPI00106BD30B|nr:uncharacterized protein LOC114537902 [Dendronephthya gigantea]